MAKQYGPYFFTGTIGGVTGYKLYGQYYTRSKSSLDAKRVKRDPAFRPLMEHAKLLGTASRLAAAVYRKLPKEQRMVSVYRKLTGRTMELLKTGVEESAIIIALEPSTVQKKKSLQQQKLLLSHACTHGLSKKRHKSICRYPNILSLLRHTVGREEIKKDKINMT